jgi:hypothetical protein
MKTKSSKTQRHIPQLVERGFAIYQQLTVLNEQFKKIKEQLKNEALVYSHEHLPLLEKESEGKQWIVQAKGCECRIIFPDAKIETEFDPGESDFLNIRSLAGKHFKALFRRVTVYRPTDKRTFRGQIHRLLKPDEAVVLLALCSSPSEPKAVWKARPAAKKEEATR